MQIQSQGRRHGGAESLTKAHRSELAGQGGPAEHLLALATVPTQSRTLRCLSVGNMRIVHAQGRPFWMRFCGSTRGTAIGSDADVSLACLISPRTWMHKTGATWDMYHRNELNISRESALRCLLCSASADVMMGHVYGVLLVAVLVVRGVCACVRVPMAGWLHRVGVGAC